MSLYYYLFYSLLKIVQLFITLKTKGNNKLTIYTLDLRYFKLLQLKIFNPLSVADFSSAVTKSHLHGMFFVFFSLGQQPIQSDCWYQVLSRKSSIMDSSKLARPDAELRIISKLEFKEVYHSTETFIKNSQLSNVQWIYYDITE